MCFAARYVQLVASLESRVLLLLLCAEPDSNLHVFMNRRITGRWDGRRGTDQFWSPSHFGNTDLDPARRKSQLLLSHPLSTHPLSSCPHLFLFDPSHHDHLSMSDAAPIVVCRCRVRVTVIITKQIIHCAVFCVSN